MEFGHVYDSLAGIDFTLPPDGEITGKCLQLGAKASERLKVYVGSSHWVKTDWLGKIYPPHTPQADFLSIYAKNFNTVEFRPSFFALYTETQLRPFADQVERSQEFKFCPFFPQTISHMRRLVNANESTDQFYQSLNAFGDHLGVPMLQLGDNFTPKDFPQLKAYLELLPTNIRVAVEVRHKEWFSDVVHRRTLFELLHSLNIAAVITDSGGRRDCVHMELPTADAVVRFVGNDLHPTDYTRIDEWVQRFVTWKERGLQSIWFFIHQYDPEKIPDLCIYLIEQLNTHLGTDLKPPHII